MLSQETHPKQSGDYRLDFSAIRADSELAPFAKAVSGITHFTVQKDVNAQTDFNSVCRKIISAWQAAFPEKFGETSPKFQEHLAEIAANKDKEKVIPTSWGGVHIKVRNDPHVEKWLVVRQGRYLAFEWHTKKEEEISVEEGAGILLYRANRADPNIQVRALLPGVKVSFAPGQEHCVIGTKALLLFEVSEDHLGMDQDLELICTPD